MTEVKIVWTERNVWNFVKYTIISKSAQQKFFFISILVCFVFIMITSIVTATVLQNTITLIISVCVPVFLLAYTVGYYFILKNYAKKIYNVNKDITDSSALISEEIIVICKNGVPKGTVSWSMVNSISINEKLAAFYIMTKENSLLLLEEANITNGSKEQLVKLLKRKKDEIEQAAENENANERAKASRKKNK